MEIILLFLLPWNLALSWLWTVLQGIRWQFPQYSLKQLYEKWFQSEHTIWTKLTQLIFISPTFNTKLRRCRNLRRDQFAIYSIRNPSSVSLLRSVHIEDVIRRCSSRRFGQFDLARIIVDYVVRVLQFELVKFCLSLGKSGLEGWQKWGRISLFCPICSRLGITDSNK